MRSLRFLALAGLLIPGCMLLTSCGGSGSKPAPPAALMITSSSPLPQATVNTPYSTVLQASGGSGTYTWGMAGGSLPPGVTLNDTTAFIMGTPTQAGTFTFTAKVTDTAGDTATANLALPVNGAIQITCTACASGTKNLPFGNPGVAYNPSATPDFSASGGVAPYTWCVLSSAGQCDPAQSELPPGLKLNASTGAITGTPTTPGTPATFSVQVTDSETIVAHGTTSAVLTIFAVGTTNLPTATIDEPYLTPSGGAIDVVAAGGSGPYTWSMTGTLPTGLSFGPCVKVSRPTCPIAGIPTVLGTSNFTVTVSDGETPPATATQPLSITVAAAVGNGTLNGNYAITMSGFDNGSPGQFILAGAFIADGQGNVTAGELDINSGEGEPNYTGNQCLGNPTCPIPQTVQTGSSYDLSAGNGLGMMTIDTLDSNGNPHTYAFQIAVNGSGGACTANATFSDCGSLILTEMDNNPQSYGSGFLKVQDSAFFADAAFFPGNFAVLLNGIDPSGDRYAAGGAFGTNPNPAQFNDITCNGNGWGLMNGCPLQANDNGSVNPDPFGGTFTSTEPDSYGRGQYVDLSFPDDPNGYCLGPTHNLPGCGYAFYIVNKNEAMLISTDPLSKPANMTLWSVHRQFSTSGWSLQQMSGNTVLELTGLGNAGPDVLTGILNCTSANCASGGSGSASFSGDENDAGTLSQQSSSGTIAVATSGDKTGQFTTSGFSQSALSNGSLFLYSGSEGYFVGGDSEVTSGVAESQANETFTTASLIGSFQGGSEWLAASAVTNSVTTMFADGQGNMTGTQNTSGPNGPGGPTPLTLTYSIGSNGRGVVQQGCPSNCTTFGIVYIVGPEKVILVPAGDAPALNVFISGQPN